MKIHQADRIFAKELTADDITDRVMEWFDDERQMKFYTNSKRKITKESLTASIEEGKKKGDNITFGIYDNTTSILFGTIKIGPMNHVHKISEVVVLIGDRSFLGIGLAVDAIKLGIKIAFEEFDIRRLIGGIYESNIASVKAYMAAGCIVEGRLKGYYLVNNKSEDRILVGCYNPKYFSAAEIQKIKDDEHRYI